MNIKSTSKWMVFVRVRAIIVRTPLTKILTAGGLPNAGKLPLWLAPTQAVVATIVSDADDYARLVVEKLKAAGLRTEIDLRNEKINYKVREHSVAKVPNLLVVGKREAEEGKVALRVLGSDEPQKIMDLDEAVAMLKAGALAPDLQQNGE